LQNVAESKADGYTLLGTTNTLLITPIRNNTPKSLFDMAPVARLVLDPMVVYVRADSKYDSNSFLEAIKNGDGSLKIACPQAGSPETMAVETLVKKYNGKIHMIPYPDSSKSLPAVLGGDVDATLGEIAELVPQLEAKTVKIVMALTSKRVPSHPDIPTFQEKGYPDVVVDKFRGYSAPKGTPPEVIKILEEALKKSLDDPEYQKVIAKNYQIPAYLGAEDFGKFLKQTEENYKTYFANQKK
jgi:tripartite-type tricarboxylate transporter receptor subunit TctC